MDFSLSLVTLLFPLMWYPSRGHNSGPIFMSFPGPFFPFCVKQKKLFFSVSHFVSHVIVPLGDLSPHKQILILRIPLLHLPSLPGWFPGGLSSPDSGFGLFWPFQNKMKSCAFFFSLSLLADKSSCALSTPGPLHMRTAFLHPRFCRAIREVQTTMAQCRAPLIFFTLSVAFSVFFSPSMMGFWSELGHLLVPPTYITAACERRLQKAQVLYASSPSLVFGFLSKCALNASSATTCILQLPKPSHAWALNKTGINVVSDLHLCTYILSSITQNSA